MSNAILVGAEKGGTGKSTVACNLAVMAKLAGYDTMLVDCDRQGSSTGFIARRNDRGLLSPDVTAQFGRTVKNQIESFASKYEIVIIDCGGHDSEELRNAMIAPSVANMICPIRSGFLDMETLAHLDIIVGQALAFNEHLSANTLINQAATNRRMTDDDEAVEFMNELENIGVLEPRLYSRSAYKRSVELGLSAVEYEMAYLSPVDWKVCGEMKSLYDLFFDPWNNDFVDRAKLKAQLKEEVMVGA